MKVAELREIVAQIPKERDNHEVIFNDAVNNYRHRVRFVSTEDWTGMRCVQDSERCVDEAKMNFATTSFG